MREQLLKVRKLIARGWIQGNLRCRNGYCLDGAILAATGHKLPLEDDGPPSRPMYDKLEQGEAKNIVDAISVHIPDDDHVISGLLVKDKREERTPSNLIWMWQDAEDRKKDEVLAVIDKALEEHK